MSKNLELLKIEKYIVSRLCYTAYAILTTEIESHLTKYTKNDIDHIKHLIETSVATHENKYEYEWISNVLLFWFNRSNSANIKEELDFIQFRYNLSLIKNDIPETMQEELLNLFKAILNAKQGNILSLNKVSSNLFQFLEICLYSKPTIICWIFDDLMHVWPISFYPLDSVLQELFINFLKLVIEKESITKCFDILLCILSKLNVSESRENELLFMLYSHLFKTCDIDLIELVLYSRKQFKFLKEWHKFVDNENIRSVQIDSVETANKINKVIFITDNNLNKLGLHPKEITLRIILRGFHWLLDILDLCSVLINNREYDKTSKILSCSVLKNLWPSLLIYFLHNLPHTLISVESENFQNSICESINFLIDKCYFQYEYNELILKNLNSYLNSQLIIVKWILNHRKKFAATAVDQNLSVKYMLSRLQNSCPLSVLKESINIHESNFQEIESLLNNEEETMKVFISYRVIQTALKAVLMYKFCNVHVKKVAKNLYIKMESLLNAINPLSLRLEVIENVFSILFLRHNAHFNIADEEDYNTALSEKEEMNIDHEKKQLEEHKLCGFICNKYSVKQLLSHLKQCTHQIGVDFAKLKKECTDTKDLKDLQKSIFNIDNAVKDALWRLELLTSLELIRSKSSKEDSMTSSNDLLHNTADENYSLPYRLETKLPSHNQTVESESEENKNAETTNIDESTQTSSSETNNTSQRRKKKKNQIPISNLSDSTTKNNDSKLIINLMLSSKESLVVQCLWKQDYTKAQEVIEKFNMKNSYLDGEIRFSKSMQSFRQEMINQMDSSDTLDYSAQTEELLLVENVRRAAQGGYWRSRITNQLETFVASQESNARLICSNATDAREILALCVVDLALTMNQSQQPSTNLLNVALKYLKVLSKLEGTHHSKHFEDVYRLVHESNLGKSVPSVICNAKHSLNVQNWKDKTDFWQNLADKTRQFQESQCLLSNIENETHANVSALSGQKIFSDVIILCGNTQNYLRKVLVHLQILYSIIPNNERTQYQSESILMSNFLHFYIGHQIFDLHNEPETFEMIANKLGVNLVHNILINCCPKLKYYDSLSTVGSETCGCIILNKISNNKIAADQKNQDPNQCVADILSELISAIQQLQSNSSRILNKDLPYLSNNSKIQQILRKSSELEFLDLSELSVGEHTLAFFLNLWNLLFIHSQLTVWATDPPMNFLRRFISLSSVSYYVGDLGRISLAVLRSKLLGCMSWDFEYFPHAEDLNEVAWQDLDLVHDPRVIFAMSNEFYETPIIRVFYPQSLNEDLSAGVRNYLDHYSVKKYESHNTGEENANETRLIVFIPDFIQHFENFQEKNISNINYNSVTSNQSYKNMFSLTDYFSKSECVILKYKPAVNSFEILLNYEDISVTNIDILKKSNINLNCYNSSMWMSRTIKPNVLQYLEGHCWLLSYLVKRIHKNNSGLQGSGCDNLQRTVCFENNSTALWVHTLANALFDNNVTLATIQENISLNDLWIYLDKCIRDDRIQDSLDFINALPNRLLNNCIEIQCLKDKLLCQLIYIMQINSNADKILQYIYQIKDINVLAQTILSNINEWPVHVCQDALIHAVHHTDKYKLPSHCRFKMMETLCRVTVFYKMLPHCKNKKLISNEITWHDVVFCTEKTEPVSIIQSLIEANKFELCLEWLEYQAFSLEIQSLVTHDLLIGLLKNDETDFKNARKLLAALPTRQSIKMCKGVLKKLESIRAMRFIIEYLLEHCDAQKAVMYYKAQIGVEIIDQLEVKERAHYMQLIKEPLIIMEQLLMNCKFENLRKIIDIVQRSDNLKKSHISIESFDKIVRFYAGKSLDFRVSLQRDGLDSKIKDTMNLSSTMENENRNSEFIMPVNVPTKENWIPNDKARECTCCKAVIFSMFNRRHHCRRCGRVVCAACSQQRMQVLGYPKLMLVRVCDDCKMQTALQVQASQGSPSTASSIALECWKLTTDEMHNQTVREEFSFEYAPNISLCLAILSLHSDHKAYASFLLDRCDEMKRLLQPVTGGRVNPEIDHDLIIKMIRSLLVAVKVKCAKLGLNAGLAHCDRFLSQVDLIATLVQSDCLALIPSDDSLDGHALRKLRDLLTEKEQWTLALDVSTKSGLDTQGVWAAWGKACLKVGHLDRARTKFSHCLEKVLHENLDDWVLVSYPDTDSVGKSNEDSLEVQKQRKSEAIQNDSANRKRQPVRSRPIKDPPLLLEIIQILENQSQLGSDNGQNTLQSKSNVAQEILITLNSLKAISQGQCSFVHNWNSCSTYYEEILYYLLTYGSFNSILEFFVNRGEFNKCLTFILENNIEPELFFNAVYLRCLKMGNIDKLFSGLKANDASLLTWKKYLVYTCHCLDKKQYLHTLYHLQIFMKDFIRSAMTCIRFYKNDAKNYIDLSSKSHYLVKAQKHLEAELNIENLNKKRRKSTGSSQSNSCSGLTMEMEPSEIDKHINTISRQLEIVKFLGNAEKEGRFIDPYLKHLLDMNTETKHSEELPTLFGNQQQKTRLAVLAILCGRDAEEGFGIAFRIMQDYNLRPQKVYSLAGHVLALDKKIGSIEQLIRCCRTSGAPNSQVISDRVLVHCVKLLLQNSQTVSDSDFKDRIDSLIRLINDVEFKISSYIESKQLKAAYLLAVKHQRAQDIKKILKEADRLGQNAIRSICTKWLKQMQNSL